MLPPLAVLTAVTARDPQLLIRQAARIGAGLVAFIGVGLLVYSARHNSFVPRAAAGWTAAGILLALVAVFVTARRARAAPWTAAGDRARRGARLAVFDVRVFLSRRRLRPARW